MSTLTLFSRFSLILLMLVMIGCSESLIEPEEPDSHSRESLLTEEELAAKKGFMTSRRFTGRDSFGIAFKARISGTYSSLSGDESMTVMLEGNGKATHLAHTHVVRSHFMTKDNITDGEVKYIGFKGDEILGIYEGSRGQNNRDGSFTFEVVEEITDGTGRFEGVEGKITTTGVFHQDGTFSYTSDGWLLNTRANKQSKEE